MWEWLKKLHCHCWHSIPGTERKVLPDTRCRKPDMSDSAYLRCGYDECEYSYEYVLVSVMQECCICNKVREYFIRYTLDSNIKKALTYPDRSVPVDANIEGRNTSL